MSQINLQGKKILILAEKPSVMRAIEALYQKIKHTLPYIMEFGAFHGHVMGLKTPEEYNTQWKSWNLNDLPMIPDCSYKATDPKFVRDLTTRIKNGGYDYVANACDAGREGELIFWAFYKTQGFSVPVLRYWANSNADSAIEKALQDLKPYSPNQFEGLKESSFLRAQLDWLVGMNFSRGATLPIGNTVTVGRVQTPTLKMVVDRELAISNFTANSFFEIEGICNKGEDFSAINLVGPDFKQSRYTLKAEAEEVLNKIKGKGLVKSVKEESKESFAPALFSLVELQKSANKAFKMTPDATLSNLQNLYEAGYVTYPRTESRYLPSAMIPELPKAIKALEKLHTFGTIASGIQQSDIDRATTGKRYIDDGRIEDHHAIIPTDKIPTSLSAKEQNIYDMIVKSFLAIFLPSCRTNSTIALIEIGGAVFRAEGTVVLDKGYTSLLGTEKKDKTLPLLTENEEIDLKKASLKEGKTTPPARYTPATLLAAMQNAGKEISDKDQAKILKDVAGIGTSATRAAILEGLIKKGYLNLEKNFYSPTDLGMSNVAILKDFDFCSPALTATWEQKLQEVENDPGKAVIVYNDMTSYITTTVESLKTLTPPVFEVKQMGVKCPQCGEDAVIGEKYYQCKNFGSATPCSVYIPKNFCGESISIEDAKLIFEGKALPKSIRVSGGTNNVCLSLIDGKFTSKPNEQASVIGKCPCCSGNIVETTYNYSCSNKNSTTPCDIKINKTMCKTKITKSDVKALISGKMTKPKNFDGFNGKFTSCLVLEGKDVKYKKA